MIEPKTVDKFKEFLMELFFPSFCLGCRKEGTYLCLDCKAMLDINQYQYCLCNKDPQRILSDSNGGKCSRCQNRALLGLYCALPYKEKFLTRKLIYQFKYEPYIKELAKPLSEIILEHLILIGKTSVGIFENSVLVPVPMDVKKMKHRGYNQSELLAQELGHKLNVLTVFGNLVKIKNTQPQMKLSAKERQENLKGAFLVKHPELFLGKKIFLIDDVYTTGSTMQECASALKASGAKTVIGIAIAREG